MRTMIDLSHWQDNKTGAPPNLAAAVNNAVDAFLFRCGRGTGTTSKNDLDPSYAMFVGQAVELGVPWGAYWWPEPNESTPTEQAWLFTDRAHPTKIPSFLDVDIEGHRGPTLTPLAQAQWQRTFIDELRHITDLPIVIYTADWYWNTNIAPAGIDFTDCDLRVAHYYPGQPPVRATGWTAWLAGRQPDPVLGFPTWAAWQFSATGNGLGPALGMESGDVDCNVITDDTWHRWFPTVDDRLDRLTQQVTDLQYQVASIGTATNRPWQATTTITRT